MSILNPSPPVFEETARVAIAAANRRRFTFWATILLSVGVLAGILIYQVIESRRTRALQNEFVAIGAQMHAEWEAFEAKSKASEKAPSLPEGLQNQQPDHGVSAQRYAAFAQKYPSAPEAWVASFRAAQYFVSQKDWVKATAVLEPVLRYTRKHDLIQVRVQRVLAGIYAQQGDFKKALGAIQQAVDTPGAPGADGLKLFRAQLLYLDGQKSAAAQALKDLSAGDPKSERFLQQDPFSKAPPLEAALWLGYWDLNEQSNKP